MTSKINLSAFASAPSKKQEAASDPRIKQFNSILMMFDTQNVRLSYESSNKILVRLGLVSDKALNVPTAGIRFLNHPDITVPWAVCNKRGMYDAKALEKWGATAPAGYGQRPIIQKDGVDSIMEQLIQESAQAQGATEVKNGDGGANGAAQVQEVIATAPAPEVTETTPETPEDDDQDDQDDDTDAVSEAPAPVVETPAPARKRAGRNKTA